jgi:hypothetical protein
VRIRHYGILATTPKTDSDLLDSLPERESSVTPTRVCPICGSGRMIVIEKLPPMTMAQATLAEPHRCFTLDSS